MPLLHSLLAFWKLLYLSFHFCSSSSLTSSLPYFLLLIPCLPLVVFFLQQALLPKLFCIPALKKSSKCLGLQVSATSAALWSTILSPSPYNQTKTNSLCRPLQGGSWQLLVSSFERREWSLSGFTQESVHTCRLKFITILVKHFIMLLIVGN